MIWPAGRTKSPHRRRQEFLLFLLPLLGVFCLGGLFLIQGLANVPGPKSVPVNLHSVLEADYGANPNFSPIQSVGLDIIWDALLDHDPDAVDLKERQEALLNSLQTPIPFVTPVTCQGAYVLYADQDTWIDSANPTGRHGSDFDLQLGRDEDRSTRLLLHFTPADTLPRDTFFIKSARLELNLSTAAGPVTPRIRLFSVAAPFEESIADWSNQPEPLLQYRADPLAAAGRHAWDATGLVHDWLLGRQPNHGLLIELLPPANALYLYHSREADSQAITQTGDLVQPLGPRLVIDCGDTPAQPETLAALTPTPLPTGSPQLAAPTPQTTPPSLLSTPTLLPATPTAIMPPATPTAIIPPATPTSIAPPAMPTSIASPGTPTVAAPSATPGATHTPVAPTSTSPAPTDRPATSTPRPTSTATPIPTLTPTSTSTPTPTSTPVPPSLSINDVTVTEGAAGSVNAVFTVSLSAASGQTVTVTYATADNTAAAPADYTTAGGVVTFAPGDTTQTLTVAVQGDTLDEIDETFWVNLSGAANATIGDGQGVGTIIDDDGLPSLSINDVTVTEGDAGSVNAVFTVSLSAASAQTVTVTYATADNTAAAPADYTTAGGTLTFAPGDTTQTIIVAVQGDTLDEPDETFLVNLSGATDAIISDGQGVGTIIDDDVAVGGCSSPVITLAATADTYFRSNQPNNNFGSDADLRTKPPSNPRNTVIQFDLSAIPANSVVTCAAFLLSQSSTTNTGQNIQVHRVTAGWVEGQATWNNRTTGNPWATPGGDFAAAVEATFVPSATTHVLNITSLAQFWVSNSASNFGLLLEAQDAGSNGEIQFYSRETANPPRLAVEYLPALSINDVIVLEGDSGVANAIFTVTMSSASGQTVSVDYTTVDNTATTGDSDYLAASGTLTFPPGITTRPITVTVIGDMNVEGDETFLVNLSNPANAAIADGQGIGTIQQDVSGFGLPLPLGKTSTIYLPLILK